MQRMQLFVLLSLTVTATATLDSGVTESKTCCLSGEKGETGKVGPKGIQGERGVRGLTGPSGPPGVIHLNECSNKREGMIRYNNKVKDLEYCDGIKWVALFPLLGMSSLLPASSCKQIALKYKSSSHNGKYWIKPSDSNPPFQVYCDASEGWTLVMKIDGSQQTFTYDSKLWSNKNTFQSNHLKLDEKETKLASYWTLPFTELRLGMKVDGAIRWITFRYRASSLYSLISDGHYRRTRVGDFKWRSLLPKSSLQRNCIKEGFNVRSHRGTAARARLGITANDDDHCISPDSFVGFGTQLLAHSPKTSVGNYACCSPDNGGLNIKAIGYVMAR